MLTILAKCSHSCLLILCEYILFIAKLKGEVRPFWNGEKHSLISYMGGGSNVNYYESAHHPVPTRKNKERPGSFQNK